MTQKLRLRIGEDEIEVEGELAFIEKHVAEFFARTPRTGVGDAGSAEPNLTKRSVKGEASGKGYSAAEFYKQKRPDGGTKSLIVLGRYLHESRGQENFTRAEIKALCSEIRIKDIHSQYYTLALKQGWMRETENGFAVTISGDELVDGMSAQLAATGS